MNFRYYFVEGHPLNDRPLLAKVAAENIAETLNKTGNNDVPLAEHEILTFLNGKEGRREIENAIKALKELGVHGIPKFIVEGSLVVDGAADSSTFVRIFREIEERGEVAGGPIFGPILGVDQSIVMKASHTKESLLL